jgi:hypothetical protein
MEPELECTLKPVIVFPLDTPSIKAGEYTVRVVNSNCIELSNADSGPHQLRNDTQILGWTDVCFPPHVWNHTIIEFESDLGIQIQRIIDHQTGTVDDVN